MFTKALFVFIAISASQLFVNGRPTEDSGLRQMVQDRMDLLNQTIQNELSKGVLIDTALEAIPWILDDVSKAVDAKLKEEIEPLEEQVSKAQEEAKKAGKDVSGCVIGIEELLELRSDVNNKVQERVDRVAKETEVVKASVQKGTEKFAAMVAPLQEEVDACETDACLRLVKLKINSLTVFSPLIYGQLIAEASAFHAGVIIEAGILGKKETDEAIDQSVALSTAALACIKAAK